MSSLYRMLGVVAEAIATGVATPSKAAPIAARRSRLEIRTPFPLSLVLATTPVAAAFVSLNER